MTTERTCTAVYGDSSRGGGYGGQLLTECGLPLVPDETSPCASIRYDERESPCGKVKNHWHHISHAYIPSRWLCPVHGEVK